MKQFSSTSTKRASRIKLALGLCMALVSDVTVAQPLNVDVDLYNSSSLVGGGAPSSAFEAASAGQSGFWNPYPTNLGVPYNLLTTTGEFTGVVIRAQGWAAEAVGITP